MSWSLNEKHQPASAEASRWSSSHWAKKMQRAFAAITHCTLPIGSGAALKVTQPILEQQRGCRLITCWVCQIDLPESSVGGMAAGAERVASHQSGHSTLGRSAHSRDSSKTSSCHQGNHGSPTRSTPCPCKTLCGLSSPWCFEPCNSQSKQVSQWSMYLCLHL